MKTKSNNTSINRILHAVREYQDMNFNELAKSCFDSYLTYDFNWETDFGKDIKNTISRIRACYGYYITKEDLLSDLYVLIIDPDIHILQKAKTNEVNLESFLFNQVINKWGRLGSWFRKGMSVSTEYKDGKEHYYMNEIATDITDDKLMTLSAEDVYFAQFEDDELKEKERLRDMKQKTRYALYDYFGEEKYDITEKEMKTLHNSYKQRNRFYKICINYDLVMTWDKLEKLIYYSMI